MTLSLPSAFLLRALLRDGRPETLAPLQDEIFDLNSDVQIVETAANFAGDGLSFSVTGPAGVTIDPVTGVLSIPTDDAYDGELVTVSATNAKGTATLSFRVTVEVADDGGEKADTTLTDSIVYDGATLVLDRPMPVGYFCNGDPFIVASEGFSITNDLPAANIADGVFRNGMLWNPQEDQNGFDSRISPGGSQAVANTISPSLGGKDPYFIPAGSRGVLVKAISLASPNGRLRLQKYVFLTVLSEVPPAGSFRPPIRCPLDWRTPKWREADLNYGVLKNLPAGGLGLPYFTELFNLIEQATMTWSTRFDEAREYRTAAAPIGGMDFSRDFSKRRAWAICRLNTAGADAEKRALLIKMVQMGIDLAGVRAAGGQWGIAGNMTHGVLAPMILAARALESEEIAALSRTVICNDREQCIWAGEVGRAQNYPSNAGHAGNRLYFQTYQQGHQGMPMFRIGTAGGNDYGSMWRSPYEVGAASTRLETIMGACLIDGGLALWCGTDEDPTAWNTGNARMASIAYMDRLRRILPVSSDNTSTSEITPRGAAIYDAHRGQLSLPAWTGNPEEPNISATITPGDGGGTFNISRVVANGGSIVRRDVRYSMDPSLGAAGFNDPRQWVEVQDVGANPVVLSGLTNGVVHFVQARVVSVIDSVEHVGAWSWIRPEDAAKGEGERGRFTPDGAPSEAAPANTVPPGIFVKVGAHTGPSPYVAPDNPVAGTVLRAGVGYWTGKPTAWTYQWTRNGTDISGATADSYTVAPGDAGAQIRVVVTADAGTSQVTAASAAVAIP